MKRSIVPIGFEVTAHPIFFQFDVLSPSTSSYSTPLRLPNVRECDSATCKPASREKKEGLDTPELKSNNVPHIRDLDDTTCPICLSPFTNPVTIVSCCHAFCHACLMKWYRVRIACPLCKCSGNYFLESELASTPPVKLWTVVQDKVLEKPAVEAAIRCHLNRFAPIHGMSMKRRAAEVQEDENVAVDEELREAMQLLRDIDSHAKRRK